MAIHLPVFREIPVAMDYSRLAQGLSLGLRSGLSPETSLELTEGSDLTTGDTREAPEGFLLSGQRREAFSKGSYRVRTVRWHGGTSHQISFYSGSSDETFFAGFPRQYTEKSIDLISQAVSVVEPTIVILLLLLVGACPAFRHDAASRESFQILRYKVVTTWNF